MGESDSIWILDIIENWRIIKEGGKMKIIQKKGKFIDGCFGQF